MAQEEAMKKAYLVWILSAATGFASSSMAQEKPKTEANEKRVETRRDLTPLRLQVVLSEFDGEKKIASLPYMLHANSDGRLALMRMGLRVPVQTGSSFQYIDIGTNMDGSVERSDDGRFLLHLTVERSSAYSATSGQKAALGGTEVTNIQPVTVQPVIQQFKTSVSVLLRDGQTIQSNLSSDPVTGRVLKVDVTLNVVK
jgi:hypothetical protein